MFLLSDDAAMITGAQLPVDGGYTIQWFCDLLSLEMHLILREP